MTNDMAVIPPPTHWAYPARTYRRLRDKLSDGRDTGVSSAVLSATIDYWIARLNQDRISIVQGVPPQVIPEPAGTHSAKATYRAITDKLLNAVHEQASKQDQIAAIDYWIARLKQDRWCIAGDAPFVPYSP